MVIFDEGNSVQHVKYGAGTVLPGMNSQLRTNVKFNNGLCVDCSNDALSLSES